MLQNSRSNCINRLGYPAIYFYNETGSASLLPLGPHAWRRHLYDAHLLQARYPFGAPWLSFGSSCLNPSARCNANCKLSQDWLSSHPLTLAFWLPSSHPQRFGNECRCTVVTLFGQWIPTLGYPAIKAREKRICKSWLSSHHTCFSHCKLFLRGAMLRSY